MGDQDRRNSRSDSGPGPGPGHGAGDGEHPARRMWRALEPVHTTAYFAPESLQVCRALGMTDQRAAYFALRAAPLGAVSAEVVAAVFYNFHPALVARAIPHVWSLAEPQRFVEARLEAVDAALRRLVGPEVLASAPVAEAAGIAREAATAARTAGRPLAAANAAQPWPQTPHLVLWHAQTVLREQRGDGHVAALLAAGIDPVETLVLFAADRDIDAVWLRKRRGWSEEEWAAAVTRLLDRGLVEHADGNGAEGNGAGGETPVHVRPTAAGRELRVEVEAVTDTLAAAPWAAVGPAAADRLVELVTPLVRAIVAGGGFDPLNAMGLRPLVAPG